ncbi:MAG: hypothetical protein NVSMB23_10590 [Myxococcales bacterium]
MALELRTWEGPLDRVAEAALRGERFVARLGLARARYGPDVALRLLARRTVSFAVRAGSSVICSWHEGMALPTVEPRLGVSLEDLEASRIAEVVALMRSAGWRDAREVVLRRLADGRRCFVAVADGRIVAQLWASRTSHNYEELWDMRLEHDEARTFDWFTRPEARGKKVMPALLSLAVRALRDGGAKHIYTSIGGDNVSSLRAAAQVLPVRRDFVFFMARGMRRPVVPGLKQSTYPTLDPVPRPFERINVTNLVL